MSQLQGTSVAPGLAGRAEHSTFKGIRGSMQWGKQHKSPEEWSHAKNPLPHQKGDAAANRLQTAADSGVRAQRWPESGTRGLGTQKEAECGTGKVWGPKGPTDGTDSLSRQSKTKFCLFVRTGDP